MKVINEKTRTERIKDMITNSKWLNSSKFFKTNKVSIAAWDSWAAQGSAGGCEVCFVKHHNATVYNKRNSSGRRFGRYGSKWHSNPVSRQMCSECYNELKKQIGFQFVEW